MAATGETHTGSNTRRRRFLGRIPINGPAMSNRLTEIQPGLRNNHAKDESYLTKNNIPAAACKEMLGDEKTVVSLHPSFSGSFDADIFSAIEMMENEMVLRPRSQIQRNILSGGKQQTDILQENETTVQENFNSKKHLDESRNETAQFYTQIERRGPILSRSCKPQDLLDISSVQMSSPLQVSTPKENFQITDLEKRLVTGVNQTLPRKDHTEITVTGATVQGPSLNIFKQILAESDTEDDSPVKVGPQIHAKKVTQACKTLPSSVSGQLRNKKEKIEKSNTLDDLGGSRKDTCKGEKKSSLESSEMTCFPDDGLPKDNLQHPAALADDIEARRKAKVSTQGCFETKSGGRVSRAYLQVVTVADHLLLSSWGLPETVLERYNNVGISQMFEWQAECLLTGNVLDGANLVYSAPTSAGKTLVAELLVLKRVVESRRKAIFILPFVSVAREKMMYMQSLFQDAGVRVDGYMGSLNPTGGFAAVDIAVCTIEKANSLVNRLLQDGTIHTLGTIVVDELHMVGDSHRGYLLELLLTKVRYMASKPPARGCSTDTSVQIIGMSATLPNLDLLAHWLGAALYQTDFRPVPLTECIKVGKTIHDHKMRTLRELKPIYSSRGDDDHIIPLCLETLNERCSVLIFCPTKNWCEKLADTIAREFYNINCAASKTEGMRDKLRVNLDKTALQDVIEQLRRTPVGLDSLLRRLVPQGVAFHHAGLSFDERDIVEGAFRQGYLRVLVATSTLSSGVNLPARRVIIRTPTFHGGIIDVLTYKQMVGRAGRKGVDTAGESILVCKEGERAKAQCLAQAQLPPVTSCLAGASGESLSSSMKRAILEVVVSGVAKSPAEVTAYANCTMLAASLLSTSSTSSAEAAAADMERMGQGNAIQACIDFLQESEFITLKKVTLQDGTLHDQYEASQLGRAVLASALSPDEGLVVFAELQRARRCFVLENELHILYQVTPVYQMLSTIDWYQYLSMWEKLSPDMRRVAELVGVSEGFLARCVRGKIAPKTLAQKRAVAVHQRFYTTLVLQDLVQEMPLPVVADKYKCTRGVLQSLQQSAATFAGMVTVFCSQLGWYNLELLLSQFQSRLTFGIQRELVDLVRISLLNAHRARVFFNKGYHTVAALANAASHDIEAMLRNAVPFQSKKRGEGESEWEAAQRNRSRCIWLTGQKGLTEHEAAELIIQEARDIVQRDLGMVGIQWQGSAGPEEVGTEQSTETDNKGTCPSTDARNRQHSSSHAVSTKQPKKISPARRGSKPGNASLISLNSRRQSPGVTTGTPGGGRRSSGSGGRTNVSILSPPASVTGRRISTDLTLNTETPRRILSTSNSEALPIKDQPMHRDTVTFHEPACNRVRDETPSRKNRSTSDRVSVSPVPEKKKHRKNLSPGGKSKSPQGAKCLTRTPSKPKVTTADCNKQCEPKVALTEGRKENSNENHVSKTKQDDGPDCLQAQGSSRHRGIHHNPNCSPKVSKPRVSFRTDQPVSGSVLTEGTGIRCSTNREEKIRPSSSTSSVVGHIPPALSKFEVSVRETNRKDVPQADPIIAQGTKSSPVMGTQLDLYSETDHFGDSFVLDTQTARLVSEEGGSVKDTGDIKPDTENIEQQPPEASCEDDLNLRLTTESSIDTAPPHSLTGHDGRDNGERNESGTYGQNNAVPPDHTAPSGGGSTPVEDGSPLLYSEATEMDLSVDVELEKYMDAYCTQRDVIAQTASPALVPANIKTTFRPQVQAGRPLLSCRGDTSTERPSVVEGDVEMIPEDPENLDDEDEVVLFDGSGCMQSPLLVAASNYERMPFIDGGQEGHVSVMGDRLEDSDEDFPPVTSRLPFTGESEEVQYKPDDNGVNNEVWEVCKELQEDLAVAMNMSGTFSWSVPSRTNEMGSNVRREKTMKNHVRDEEGALGYDCGTLDDSLTFSMIENVLNTAGTAQSVPGNQSATSSGRPANQIVTTDKLSCDTRPEEKHRDNTAVNNIAKRDQPKREARTERGRSPVPGTSGLGQPADMGARAKRKVLVGEPGEGTAPPKHAKVNDERPSPGQDPHDDSAASDCVPPTPPNASLTTPQHTTRRTRRGAAGTPRHDTPASKGYRKSKGNKTQGKPPEKTPTRTGLRPRINPTYDKGSHNTKPNTETTVKEHVIRKNTTIKESKIIVIDTDDDNSDSDTMKATPPSTNLRKSQRTRSESSKKKIQSMATEDLPCTTCPVQLPVLTSSPTPSLPMTNQSFTIIDVAANRLLFEHFLQEWKTKTCYTICLACENLPAPQANATAGIGSNFTKPGAGPTSRPSEVPDGLSVEGVGVVVVGIAICWENLDAYFISLSEKNIHCDLDESLAPPPLDSELPLEERLEAIKDSLGSRYSSQGALCTKVAFDVRNQYKRIALACKGTIGGNVQDPKVAVWLVDPGAKEQTLHRMVHNNLPLHVHLLDGLGGGIGVGSVGGSPDNPGSGRVRACVECVLVTALMRHLVTELDTKNLLKSFSEVEMPVQIVLARMELNGFGFSEEECETQRAIIQAKITSLEDQAYTLAGHPFSLSSTQDISQVLFLELKLPPSGDPSNPSVGTKTLGPARRTTGARGQQRTPFSTSKDVLEKLRPLHPLPGVLLEWRRLTAALTKVVFPLTKEKVYNVTLDMPRMHTACHTHTATGRVSMAEPNLQNIPKDFEIQMPDVIGESPQGAVGGVGHLRSTRGRRQGRRSVVPTQPSRSTGEQAAPAFAVSMRHAFVPFKAGVLVAADYSQLELRMIAHLSGDSKLIRILNEDGDVFKLITAQWKGIDIHMVTAEQRQQAKQVCYGMIYGIGPRSLGEQLGVDENDASVFIETFKAKYPGMRSYLRETVQKCRCDGYVETVFGRRRYLPAIKDTNPHARSHAERQAVNTTVQGSAADLVKKAMINIETALEKAFPTAPVSHQHVTSHSAAPSQRRARHKVAPPGAYLVLQLHDELIYEVRECDVMKVARIIKTNMESAMTFSVRLPVKVKSGPTWGKLVDLVV